MSDEQKRSEPIVWGVQLGRNDPPAKRMLWGAFLIVLGGLLLLSRLGYLDVPSVWRLWPLVLVVIGAGHVLERRPGAAAAMTLLGLSFLAAEFRFLGLTYHTFWPLLVISVGIGLVLGALTREDARSARGAA